MENDWTSTDDAESSDPRDPQYVVTLEKVVGQRVRELRELREWSQSDLAERLIGYGVEIHQTTVAKLERANRPIRVNELAALAGVFDVDPSELLQYRPSVLMLASERFTAASRAVEAAKGRLAEAQQQHIQQVAELKRAEQDLKVAGQTLEALRSKVKTPESLDERVARIKAARPPEAGGPRPGGPVRHKAKGDETDDYLASRTSFEGYGRSSFKPTWEPAPEYGPASDEGE